MVSWQGHEVKCEQEAREGTTQGGSVAVPPSAKHLPSTSTTSRKTLAAACVNSPFKGPSRTPHRKHIPAEAPPLLGPAHSPAPATKYLCCFSSPPPRGSRPCTFPSTSGRRTPVAVCVHRALNPKPFSEPYSHTRATHLLQRSVCQALHFPQHQQQTQLSCYYCCNSPSTLSPPKPAPAAAAPLPGPAHPPAPAAATLPMLLILLPPLQRFPFPSTHTCCSAPFARPCTSPSTSGRRAPRAPTATTPPQHSLLSPPQTHTCCSGPFARPCTSPSTSSRRARGRARRRTTSTSSGPHTDAGVDGSVDESVDGGVGASAQKLRDSSWTTAAAAVATSAGELLAVPSSHALSG